LITANHFKTARAYIVYREQHTKLRQDRKTVVDVESSINEYLNQIDWRVNANANQGYSLGGLILNVSGKVVANYWLNHLYPLEVGIAHREGDIHVHDLENAMTDLSIQAQLKSDEVFLTEEERQPCEVWTRVMGYHRPVASFNIGKKAEHYDRKHFQENRIELDA